MSPAAPSESAAAPLRWGILSTGHIAGVFARGLATARAGRLVAVSSRDAASARRFAAAHGVDPAHAHGSAAAMLADPAVEAVYVATPHPHHAAAVLAALAAGKHVLCEKPMGMSLAEVDAMQVAARRHDRTLMEAWMYRCHPQTAALQALLRDGVIGEVRHVQAAFSFNADFDPAGRLFNKALGGGGILDVGGYPLSYARLVAGIAAGAPFLEPDQFKAVGRLHPATGVDVWAAAVLRFPGGMTAELACGTQVHQDNVVRVYGSEGLLLVPSPYVITRGLEPTRLEVRRTGEAVREITITPDRSLYAYEADAVAAAVRTGCREVPACTWADTRGNLAGLLQWCAELGLHYA